MTSSKRFYRRNLPHLQPVAATLFVTFCLIGSHIHKLNPNEKTTNDHKRAFARWDTAIDTQTTGFHWLKNREVAQMLSDTIHYRDGKAYTLHTYTIMSNHVHLLVTPLQNENDEWIPLQTIMRSLKSYSAKKANKILGRSGQFWQRESYDHIVRDDTEFNRIQNYIINNPVKAGIVSHWQDYPWTYRRTPL